MEVSGIFNYRISSKFRNYVIGIFMVCAFALYVTIYLIRKNEIKTHDLTDTERLFQSPKKKSYGEVKKFKSVDNNNDEVTIKLLSGSLRGKKLTLFSSTIYAFLGIPYAEPPVGELRFASPEPVKPWNGGVKNVLDFKPICPQIMFPQELVPMSFISEKMSENCLNLNIWSPDIKPNKLKTVMVWIHGGAFNYNSANLHETDGRILSSFGDVVVVTINYRVGAFGFLNTRTEEAPGNMGIYDQMLALNWIKDNIRNFGGDPNKIVPFGEGAGAISIGILMTHNNTKNIFSRAITQSGSFLAPQPSNTFDNSVKFAKVVGCLSEENKEEFVSFSEDVVECLKNKPFDRLIEATNYFSNRSLVPFMPSIDGFFEDIESPMNTIEDTDAFSNMKELMSGVVKDEGTLFLSLMNPKLFQKHTYPQLRTLKKTRQMFIDLAKNKSDISEEMVKTSAESFITGSERDSPLNNIHRLANAFGDTLINCPTVFLADEMINRNKTVYMYSFNHRPKSSKFGDWLGVVHYEEVPFVFGYPLKKTNVYSKQDIVFSERIMKIWTHFAKTGKVLAQLDLNWPKYSEELSSMILSPKNSSVITNFNSKSCELYKTMIRVNG